MYGGLLEKYFLYQDLPLGPSDMLFQYQMLLRYRPIWGVGYVSSRACGGERVRTDKRCDTGVGAGHGKPGSNARVWRSLDVGQHVDVEPAERGKHNTEEDCRDGRSGEVWRRGDPQDKPPP
jgi:hypothetical protein